MVRTYHQMPTYAKLHLSEGTWGAHVDNFWQLQPKKYTKEIRSPEWKKVFVPTTSLASSM